MECAVATKSTSEETAMVKREWWQEWEEEDIPDLDYIIQSYDTAYSKKETADYSAITTWGVFRPYKNSEEHLILLDAKKGRWNFPELKTIAREEFEYWDPELMLIEAKASGQPLADEMRLLNSLLQPLPPVVGRVGEVWTRQRVCILFRLFLNLAKCGILLEKNLLTKSSKRLHHFLMATMMTFVIV